MTRDLRRAVHAPRHNSFVLLLAHAGHWLIWVLYAVPVLIVAVSIVASVLRQRREGAGDSKLE